MKDFILFDHEKEKNFSIRDYLRQPLYTYEYKKTAELMLEMRKTFNNIVIVLDEYGATAGLITLEDMLEEIVGEIPFSGLRILALRTYALHARHHHAGSPVLHMQNPGYHRTA